MFDTPGVPHSHQLSARLTPDEVQPAIDLMHFRLVLPLAYSDFESTTVHAVGLIKMQAV